MNRLAVGVALSLGILMGCGKGRVAIETPAEQSSGVATVNLGLPDKSKIPSATEKSRESLTGIHVKISLVPTEDTHCQTFKKGFEIVRDWQSGTNKIGDIKLPKNCDFLVLVELGLKKDDALSEIYFTNDSGGNGRSLTTKNVEGGLVTFKPHLTVTKRGEEVGFGGTAASTDDPMKSDGEDNKDKNSNTDNGTQNLGMGKYNIYNSWPNEKEAVLYATGESDVSVKLENISVLQNDDSKERAAWFLDLNVSGAGGYQIKSASEKSCLEVKPVGETYDRAELVLAACSAKNENQLFDVKIADKGKRTYNFVVLKHSGYAVDVVNDGTNDKVNVMALRSSSTGQYWYLKSVE
jgi:hypothetical protein